MRSALCCFFVCSWGRLVRVKRVYTRMDVEESNCCNCVQKVCACAMFIVFLPSYLVFFFLINPALPSSFAFKG